MSNITDTQADALSKIQDAIVWNEAEIIKAQAKADSSKTSRTKAKWVKTAEDLRGSLKDLRAERNSLMHDTYSEGASYGAIAKVLDLSTTYVRKTVMAVAA